MRVYGDRQSTQSDLRIRDLEGPLLRLVERAILDRLADVRGGAKIRYRAEERVLRERLADVRAVIDEKRAECLARSDGLIREIHARDAAEEACLRCGEGVPCCARHAQAEM